MAGLTLERAGPTPLVEQIARHVEAAISEGALSPGGRLPSWRDLAAQLGVARGTVKAAYELLIDRQLLVAAGAAGTRVADPLPSPTRPPAADDADLVTPDVRHEVDLPLVFRMGVPAHDAFPATVWSRLHRQAVQQTSMLTGHLDPRGLPALRAALAAHVAIARGVACSPDQVIVTTGFRASLATALQAVGAAGGQAWVEDPGYPVARRALELSGLHPVAVRVDGEGVDVAHGRNLAPRAALAFVTPGQQAPTGVVLSPRRRQDLLRWAAEAGAWVIEDDYLGELQLSGRSAPALASSDHPGRVIHIGSFSKTLSPMLGVGFLVAPLPLAQRLIDIAVWLSAPPNAAVQLALAMFLREGHYLRHLRRMRQLYARRRSRLVEVLGTLGAQGCGPAGLAVMLPLPHGFDDWRLAERARAVGLAPAPLSPWFAAASQLNAGLLLGVSNAVENRIVQHCHRLLALISEPAHAAGRSAGLLRPPSTRRPTIDGRD
ncbi:MocR-like pyridoxine biosynthesis transcription factor PdxR [Chelatococcus reniformis]|nr:PLP-dependent aminotransferase family protein [Chelatococcus reniformis]